MHFMGLLIFVSSFFGWVLDGSTVLVNVDWVRCWEAVLKPYGFSLVVNKMQFNQSTEVAMKQM